MKLTKEQAIYCANIFFDYFEPFNSIEEYIREQKLNSLSNRSAVLPGMGPEEDLFSDFTMHPNDMNFELIELPQDTWDVYLNMISSHSNMTSIPGRCLRLAILEKKTKKWIGFIRLGSPVINMKPRNQMLDSVFTQSAETASAFNKTSIMGFVIVPSQPFGFNYLGGKLLAAICCSHEIREMLNKKYNMNTCLFETTSLYGSSKNSSQYDGMKPYLRFKGLTDSDFVPMLNGNVYKKMKDYVEESTGEQLIDPTDSSKKIKATARVINMIRVALKQESELIIFNKTIEKAKRLTEKKRYYVSNYGFKNFIEVVNGKENKLIPDKENFDKFYMENIIDWWKKKATNRYETLKSENRIREEIEVWTGEKNIDIIR